MDRHWRFARAEDKLARLSKQGLDMVAFWRACAPVLADAVPSDAALCCFTLDPASGLVTSHFNEEMLVLPPEWIANEYIDDDVNKLTDVARSPSGVSTLYEATGGDPSSSPRWHALMADGGDQEMIAALRSRGDVWGAITMYRRLDRPLFDAYEQAFLAAVSPLMAAAVRRALLIGSRHHGLQRHVARLNEVPPRLRRLGCHLAFGVQDSDDEGVATGAKTAFQGSDIHQDPITDGRGSHQVGIGEGRYLRGWAGATACHAELHGTLPLTAHLGNRPLGPNDHVPDLRPMTTHGLRGRRSGSKRSSSNSGETSSPGDASSATPRQAQALRVAACPEQPDQEA